MSVVSLSAAKAFLSITRDVNDAELQGTIDAAEAIIANYVGALTVGSSTTVRVLGGPQLVLPTAPVATVTSITTPGGQVIDLTAVTVKQAEGLVFYTDNTFGFSNSVYDVTYTTGWTTVPGDLLLAIKEMVRSLWASRLGGGTRANSQGAPEAAPGSFVLPSRVEQLIEPYRHINIGAA